MEIPLQKGLINMAFREITPEQLTANPFTLINRDWMLITAGDEQKHNTMTASWGEAWESFGETMSRLSISVRSATPWNL